MTLYKNVDGMRVGMSPQEEASFLDSMAATSSVEAKPSFVSSRQFKMQLYKNGILDSVKAWVAQQDPLTQIAFNESSTFVKDDAMMKAGFTAMGFTTAERDAFFLEASKL